MCLAIPGKVVTITGVDPLSRVGKVDFGGVFKQVSLACTPDAEIGQYVLVHVGVALAVVDEEEARKTFEYLAQMDELAELEEPDGSVSLGREHPRRTSA
jgi:hydrogenase expression/formation protein HypC